MMSLQERVVQKVNGLSEDNLQFLLEMIERFMWTDSTEEKTGDEGTLTPKMKAFLELEEMLVPVSEELDYDKELAEARQENMIILVDTNIALDFLTMRQPFYNDARKVIRLCASEKVQGFIAFHSLPNIFYILRKSHSDADRRKMLRKLCLVLHVTGASHERVCSAIERDDFSDFEDCLQDECAKEVSADYIVTRNIGDFQSAKVKAITPQDLLEMIGS